MRSLQELRGDAEVRQLAGGWATLWSCCGHGRARFVPGRPLLACCWPAAPSRRVLVPPPAAQVPASLLPELERLWAATHPEGGPASAADRRSMAVQFEMFEFGF